MSAIPCKRPRVTVDQRVDHDAFDVNCRVPGCDFTYPRDKSFVAIKSDAEATAARHRQQHRVAVPRTWIERDPEYDVFCEPCGGHRRTFGTRTDAQAWLSYHLSTDHGLVSC